MKLLASDFDGTLIHHDGLGVDKNDIKAINRWQDKNNLFGIASGRSLRQIYLDLDISAVKQDFTIAHNGAKIYSKDRTVLYDKHIDNEILADVRKIINDHDLLNVMFFSSDESELVYSSKDFVIDNDFKHYENIVDKELTNVHKIVIVAKTNAEVRSLESDLFKKYADQLESHWNNGPYTEISAAGVNKAYALKTVASLFQIKRDNIYTYGDSHNDFLMLKTFKGYTLPLAVKGVKEVSLEVLPNINELIKILLKV